MKSTEAGRLHKWSIIKYMYNLSGGRKKRYLAAARRGALSGVHQKNYLTAARRVIWRLPEIESYLAAARQMDRKIDLFGKTMSPEELSSGSQKRRVI